MKILFVSAVLPYPLYSGGQIRIYNLLKELSRIHEITLFCFIRGNEEKKYLKDLSFCKRVETVYRGHAWQPTYVLQSIFGPYPLLLSTYNNRDMRTRLHEAIQKESFDLMHIEPGYVWPSVPHHALPIVASEHNIEHTIYEDYVRTFPIVPLRSIIYSDVLKLMFWEKRIWQKANHVVAVSDNDRRYIQSVAGESKVSVVPNGVDLDQFPMKKKSVINQKAPVFLFVGNFLWIQNRDAVKFFISDIWPAVREKYPAATVRIVGKRMPAKLKNKMADGMSLLEHVEDIKEEYDTADILLAPIRIGGGTKYKILEAMASGLPVVTTTKGAEGLDIKDGKELMIADTKEEIVKAVSKLVENEKARLSMREAARRKIEHEYSWKIIAKELDAVWKKTYEQSH